MSQEILSNDVSVGDITMIEHDDARINLSKDICMVTSVKGVTYGVIFCDGTEREVSNLKVIMPYREVLKAFTAKGVELVERTKDR